MSKFGRNDPCTCGSGKKYKNCCLKKEASAAEGHDLFKVSRYGSEAYEKNELDKFSSFFIETTSGEKFEIKKDGLTYAVKDMVPPEITMQAKSYKTVEIDDIQLQRLKTHNPEYDYLSIDTYNCYDGVVKGGHFAWERAYDLTSSRGKIDKLYIKQPWGTFLLKVNLFPLNGDIKSVDKYIETGFTIHTEAQKLDFISRDGKLYFEGCQVFAILSIIDNTSLSVEDLLSGSLKEYNVGFDIAIGQPIFIVKTQEEGLKLSIINEGVLGLINLN